MPCVFFCTQVANYTLAMHGVAAEAAKERAGAAGKEFRASVATATARALGARYKPEIAAAVAALPKKTADGIAVDFAIDNLKVGGFRAGVLGGFRAGVWGLSGQGFWGASGLALGRGMVAGPRDLCGRFVNVLQHPPDWCVRPTPCMLVAGMFPGPVEGRCADMLEHLAWMCAGRLCRLLWCRLTLLA